MFNRRQFLGASAGVVASPFVVRAAHAQEPEISLKLHHFLGPKAPAHSKMLQPWADKIQADSGGRVKIELFPSMSLGGKPPDLFKQVRDGVVDIVWTVDGYTAGLFPRSEVFELPGINSSNMAAVNLAMRELFDSHLADEYKDVHVLWLHVHAGQGLHMADKLVRSPADLAGLKLRVPGPTGVAIIEALGATPVPMPVSDLPQALTTHGVDGALIPWEIIPALKLQDSTKYQIEGPNNGRFGSTVFQVSMNKAKWEALPDDLKTVFNNACNDEWLKQVAAIWRASDNGGIKVATDAGNEHIVLTEAEYAKFQETLAPVVDKWIAAHPDFDAKGLAEAAKAAIAKHSA